MSNQDWMRERPWARRISLVVVVMAIAFLMNWTNGRLEDWSDVRSLLIGGSAGILLALIPMEIYFARTQRPTSDDEATKL